VNQPGDYTVIVTNAATGCTTQQTVSVTKTSDPELVASADGTINCANPRVNLTAGPQVENVSFTWQGFEPGQASILVEHQY